MVSINHFSHDTESEIQLLQKKCAALGVPAVVARHWAQGGPGAEALARKVVELANSGKSELQFAYPDEAGLAEKIAAIASRIYGAASVAFEARAKARIEELEKEGYGRFPVCIAKTQYSFSSDATLRGAPAGHTLTVREVRLAAGAEFVVAICGDIMTMPGLPKIPTAVKIDIGEDGKVVGLF
jgi:formate--tetrahydrofolate ligase